MSKMYAINKFGEVLRPKNNWIVAIYILSIIGILVIIWFYLQDKAKPIERDIAQKLMAIAIISEEKLTVTIQVSAAEVQTYTYIIANEQDEMLLSHESELPEHTFEVGRLPFGKYQSVVKTANETIMAGGFELYHKDNVQKLIQ